VRGATSPFIFGLVMLGLGLVCLFFAGPLRSLMIKLSGQQKRLSEDSFLRSNRAVASIRASGILAIVLGLFLLWAAHYH
jgi:hypothetical protein